MAVVHLNCVRNSSGLIIWVHPTPHFSRDGSLSRLPPTAANVCWAARTSTQARSKIWSLGASGNRMPARVAAPTDHICFDTVNVLASTHRRRRAGLRHRNRASGRSVSFRLRPREHLCSKTLSKGKRVHRLIPNDPGPRAAKIRRGLGGCPPTEPSRGATQSPASPTPCS